MYQRWLYEQRIKGGPDLTIELQTQCKKRSNDVTVDREENTLWRIGVIRMRVSGGKARLNRNSTEAPVRRRNSNEEYVGPECECRSRGQNAMTADTSELDGSGTQKKSRLE
jgi:hypothetical protein